MSGSLTRDNRGNLVYIVKSYGQMVYLYRDGLWFYDFQSGRHAHHYMLYPRLDKDGKLVVVNYHDLYTLLRSDISNEEFLLNRQKELSNRINSLVPTRKKNIRTHYYGPKIKFKVTDIIKKDNDTIEIVVTIFGMYDKNGFIDYENVQRSPYLPMLTKEYIEGLVTENIVNNIKEYLPIQKITKYLNIAQIPEDGYIKFVFDHKEQPKK